MASPKPKFWSKGSLRIMDAPDLHDEITYALGEPTEVHIRGDDVPGKEGKKWNNDIWILETPIDERSEIHEHLEWLCQFIEPHEESIKNWACRRARIDFYFSYASNHDHCGFGLSPELLDVFPRLGIRMEVSIMT